MSVSMFCATSLLRITNHEFETQYEFIPLVYWAIAWAYFLSLKSLLPAAFSSSASSWGDWIGLEGLEPCGGGAGAASPSPLAVSSLPFPLGMGTEKFVCADKFCGGEPGEAPLTGSRSMSMELLPLMADCANEDKRWRSSGGKFSGCVSGSYLDRREEEEPGSVECREPRDGREDLKPAAGDSM